MQFENLNDFLNMGGHALYVWLAYGTTLTVLVVNFFFVRSALKSEERRQRWERQQADQ